MKPRDAERSKNFFALGLVSWMYTRPVEPTVEWIEEKFAEQRRWCRAPTSPRSRPGYNFGETAELFDHPYEVAPARLPPGRYRNITGNLALSYGLIAASQQAQAAAALRVVPDHAGVRHPARALEAQELRRAHAAGRGRDRRGRRRDRRRVRRPPRGHRTSGPGVDLKSEAIGLAVSLELPLLVVDVQRGGPSTGLPTKTEQADLLLAMYGRHGEAPLPIVAARSPSHCFDAAFEAVRIAVEVPHAGDPPHRRLPRQRRRAVAAARRRRAARHLGAVRDRAQPRATRASGRTCATPRRWPGRGRSRARRGSCTASAASRSRTAPATSTTTPRTTSTWCASARREGRAASPTTSRRSRSTTPTAPSCSCSGGGARGASSSRRSAGRATRRHAVAHAHLVHLNPFPPNLGEVLAPLRPKVLVPEMNLGQLSRLVRAEFLVDAQEPHQGAGRAVPRRPRSRSDRSMPMAEAVSEPVSDGTSA